MGMSPARLPKCRDRSGANGLIHVRVMTSFRISADSMATPRARCALRVCSSLVRTIEIFHCVNARTRYTTAAQIAQPGKKGSALLQDRTFFDRLSRRGFTPSPIAHRLHLADACRFSPHPLKYLARGNGPAVGSIITLQAPSCAKIVSAVSETTTASRRLGLCRLMRSLSGQALH